MNSLFFICSLFLFSPVLPSSPEPVPLLILKAPHSGSSWLTAELNKFKGVYITEEIFAGEDRLQLRMQSDDKFNPKNEDFIGYLTESFQHPMKPWPQGVWEGKNVSWRVLGATFNPFLANYINLLGLPRKVPNLRVIVFTRSNKVKHAVSCVRAKLLKAKCDTYVVRHACSLPKLTNVDVPLFNRRLRWVLATDRYIFKTISQLVRKLGKRNIKVFHYEWLQNGLEELDGLLDWIMYDLDLVSLNKMSHSYTGRCRNNCSKNTSDDLRDVIVNYQEIEDLISEKYPCLLRQFYEKEPGVVHPDVNLSCGDFFDKQLDQYIENHLMIF